MKKHLAVILVLVLMLSFSGCGAVNQGERNTISVYDCPILVQCNDTLVMPYVNFSWSTSFHDGEWLSADGRSISRNFPEIQNEIPQITYSEDFEIHCRKKVSVSRLTVYDGAFELLQSEQDQTVLSELTEGEYYLVIQVTIEGDYIRSEEKFESSGYQCVYKMTILQ